MAQNNQYDKGTKATRTVRAAVVLTPDEYAVAQRFAPKHGGSIGEVLRAGLRALEREHKRTMEPRP